MKLECIITVISVWRLTTIRTETIELRVDSTSTSGTSGKLKVASQTPIILCISSSMPLLDSSGDISAPHSW